MPKVVRQDNLKAAVVRACLYDPDVSEVYAAFARHWGFVPLPSRPYHPQENGIAERSGGYVKHNALKGRRFDSLEALATFLRQWNRTVAQLRIHGTTRKQVLRHFLEVERPALRPLPAAGFALFETGRRTVHRDGHIQVEGAFYSVPHVLVGRDVRVQWDAHLVRVFADGEDEAPATGAGRGPAGPATGRPGSSCVAVHTRHEAGTFATQHEHRPAHKPGQQVAYE
ncbi:MAG: Mu transposase domain-containing protein, partial [Acidimicrobiales bacterium]